jgi:hypothetical protein
MMSKVSFVQRLTKRVGVMVASGALALTMGISTPQTVQAAPFMAAASKVAQPDAPVENVGYYGRRHHGYYHHRSHRGRNNGAAIAAGLLAVGALGIAAAAASEPRRDYYYDGYRDPYYSRPARSVTYVYERGYDAPVTYVHRSHYRVVRQYRHHHRWHARRWQEYHRWHEAPYSGARYYRY